MGDSEPIPVLQLQINVVSARDLASVSRSMQTYAVVYINPEQKMTTKVDTTGNNSPEWNEKFTFLVVPQILYSDFCTVVIEIYARSWIRDVLVGSVQVPAHQITPAHPTAQTRRAVALQIRRASGRPQGILNVAVSLIEDSDKPMSAVGAPDDKSRTVRRIKSERSSVVADEDRSGSLCNGPAAAGGGGSLCSSDVGPSASVVAAAVARGLYVPPKVGRRGRKTAKDDGESSILLWADEETEEAMKAKIERWKTELKMNGRDAEGARRNHRRRHNESVGGKAKVIRCFGNAYGFEFTIVCGGNNQGKKVHNKKVNRTLSDGSSYL